MRPREGKTTKIEGLLPRLGLEKLSSSGLAGFSNQHRTNRFRLASLNEEMAGDTTPDKAEKGELIDERHHRKQDFRGWPPLHDRYGSWPCENLKHRPRA